MSGHPFHHGRLREELLLRAEQVLREEGLDALSLRELARQAGVSHGAPRRHFADRQALLDALAEQGFRRLTDTMLIDTSEEQQDPAARFRTAAETYVRFAAHEPTLHELMFAAKSNGSTTLHDAADRFFAITTDLLTLDASSGHAVTADDPRRLVVAATLQGIASLVASGRVPESAIPALVDEATRVFAASRRSGG